MLKIISPEDRDKYEAALRAAFQHYHNTTVNGECFVSFKNIETRITVAFSVKYVPDSNHNGIDLVDREHWLERLQDQQCENYSSLFNDTMLDEFSKIATGDLRYGTFNKSCWVLADNYVGIFTVEEPQNDERIVRH